MRLKPPNTRSTGTKRGKVTDAAPLVLPSRAVPEKIQFKNMSLGLRWPRWGRIATLFAGLSFVGCGSAKPVPASNQTPILYTPEEATLFNDLFRPELFGLEAANEPPEADRLLGYRTARADAVLPVKITTITHEDGTPVANFSVVVQPVGPPLSGRLGKGAITLAVPQNSPAFGWIAGAGSRFVGTRMLVFLREYDDALHFHATVDTPSVREAVERARIGSTRR